MIYDDAGLQRLYALRNTIWLSQERRCARCIRHLCQAWTEGDEERANELFTQAMTGRRLPRGLATAVMPVLATLEATNNIRLQLVDPALPPAPGKKSAAVPRVRQLLKSTEPTGPLVDRTEAAKILGVLRATLGRTLRGVAAEFQALPVVWIDPLRRRFYRRADVERLAAERAAKKHAARVAAKRSAEIRAAARTKRTAYASQGRLFRQLFKTELKAPNPWLPIGALSLTDVLAAIGMKRKQFAKCQRGERASPIPRWHKADNGRVYVFEHDLNAFLADPQNSAPRQPRPPRPARLSKKPRSENELRRRREQKRRAYWRKREGSQEHAIGPVL